MLVHQILKMKSDDTVVTAAPSSTVAEAAAVLSARRIGTVVISKDGKTAVGILSERDIVREIGRSGAACLQTPVEEMMTRDIVTCSLEETADSILEKMSEGRFRHMPVVEKGEMIGLITQGDVVKARLHELAMEKNALQGMIMGH